MATLSEKCITLTGEETPDHVLTGKLKESKKRLGNLIIIDLLVCPLLITIVLISLWIEMGYPDLSTTGICSVIKHLDPTYVIASLILWVVSHSCNLLLLVAIQSDNARYCKTYGSTLGPLMEVLVLFFFALLMWSSLSPLPNYSAAKFIIVVCSVTAIVANFYNYLMNVMVEHFQLLARFQMMKYKMVQEV